MIRLLCFVLLMMTDMASARVELLDSGKVEVDWQDTEVLNALEELSQVLGFRVLLHTDAETPYPSRKLTLQQRIEPDRLLPRLLRQYSYLVRYGASGIREVTLLGPRVATISSSLREGHTGSDLSQRVARTIQPDAPAGQPAFPVHEMNRRRLAGQQSGSHALSAPASGHNGTLQEGAEAEGQESRSRPTVVNPQAVISPELLQDLVGLTGRARDQVVSLAQQLSSAGASQPQESPEEDR